MSENNLKRDYPRIFLTDELGEVNWCQDRITAEDVEYVPISDLLNAQDEVTRLREALKLIAGNTSGEPNARQCASFAREALAPKAPS